VSQAWLRAAAWRQRLGEKISLKSKVENIGTDSPRSAKSGPKARVPVQPEMPSHCGCSLRISDVCQRGGLDLEGRWWGRAELHVQRLPWVPWVVGGSCDSAERAGGSWVRSLLCGCSCSSKGCDSFVH